MLLFFQILQVPVLLPIFAQICCCCRCCCCFFRHRARKLSPKCLGAKELVQKIELIPILPEVAGLQKLDLHHDGLSAGVPKASAKEKLFHNGSVRRVCSEKESQEQDNSASTSPQWTRGWATSRIPRGKTARGTGRGWAAGRR